MGILYTSTQQVPKRLVAFLGREIKRLSGRFSIRKQLAIKLQNEKRTEI